MLRELDIKNLGPIRSAEVNFAPGMTAITGETGAGKSMLLNALTLVRGGQADPARISVGESGSWAQAVFDIFSTPEAAQIAVNAGAEAEDDELFLTRRVPQTGRSRAILNGHTVPRGVLQEISDYLITVHGQSDQLRLISPAHQRDFLDSFARNTQQYEAFTQAWQTYKDLDSHLEKLNSQQVASRQRADYLRDSIAAIERVDPQPNEDKELKARRDAIENSASIIEAVSGALGALDASQLEGDQLDAESVVTLLSQASSSLRGVKNIPALAQAADDIDEVSAKVSDIVYSLSSQLGSVEDSEIDLDQLNERLHDLNELTRRWGPDIEEVRAWLEKARFELEDVDASPEKLEELVQQRRQAKEAALALARTLHDTRRQAAEKLSKRVSEELKSLAMPGATLSVIVTQREGQEALTSSGIDDVAFLFTAFRGAGELPLGKSASGGELSRLMLAMELVNAESRADLTQKKVPATSGPGDSLEPSTTFVFDEVDAGVGGEAAVELGKRLAQLALSAQVIVVTHLPQVASWANSQFVVNKATDSAQQVETTVTQVEGEERVAEIARMLSGSDSQASLDHARELLDTTTLAAVSSGAAQKTTI